MFRDNAFTCALTHKSWVLNSVMCGKMVHFMSFTRNFRGNGTSRAWSLFTYESVPHIPRERRICPYSFLVLCGGAAHTNDEWNRIICCFNSIHHVNSRDFYNLLRDRFVITKTSYPSAFCSISWIDRYTSQVFGKFRMNIGDLFSCDPMVADFQRSDS